ncbi:MAG: NAD(P)/FAD-dependent oxidoreductase [Burkholderiales bacterium]
MPTLQPQSQSQSQSQLQPVCPGARLPRIVIIGAGPGGLCMAIKLKAAGFSDFVLLEREDEVGGTWINNRYPGLACDVPSILYSFSFEQKPDWTRAYAQQPEIKAYMQHVAEKYGVLPHVRFNTGVRQARWDDASCQWHLTTTTGEAVVADVLVSALGMFNQTQWPNIPGLGDFAGEVLHTAHWPKQGKDLRGRRVGVIGSAGSAVQLIPEVAREAARLVVFQRTANWVMPKKDATYDEAELAEFRRQPERGPQLRQACYEEFEARITFANPNLVEATKAAALQNLAQVVDPAVREQLHPQVPLGAQRPLYSNEYYPTFNLPHVTLVSDEVERVTPSGVQTSAGAVEDLDLLILATGYAANKFLSVIEVSGRDGLALKDAWRDGPQAYLGITTAGFPNLFMIYGPNTNNGSILTMIEHQSDYIVARLQDMHRMELDWIDVRPQVMADYNDKVQQAIQSIGPWRTLGTKYYRAASGRVVTQWPYTMATYEAWTRASGLEVFETRHRRAGLKATTPQGA